MINQVSWFRCAGRPYDMKCNFQGEPKMKSNNSLIIMAVMFLLFATVSSVVIWSDVSIAAKIGFFAFGYGAGITTGILIARRQR